MLLKCTCQESEIKFCFVFFHTYQHNNVPVVTNSPKPSQRDLSAGLVIVIIAFTEIQLSEGGREGVTYGAAMKSFDSAVTPHVSIMANLCYALVIKGTCLLLLSHNSHVKPITHQPNAVPSYMLITIIN